MKPNALCNSGFEMPTSEIAAFHLHRSTTAYLLTYLLTYLWSLLVLFVFSMFSVGTRGGPPRIVKLKNTRVSTKTKRFYLTENAQRK